MQPPMPSAVTTQRASPVTGAAEPASLAEALQANLAASEENSAEEIRAIVTSTAKMTLQELVDAPTYYFKFDIIDNVAPTANFDPKNAVRNLNAVLQQTVGEKVGVEIPKELFDVTFEKPTGAGGSDGKMDLGYFLCGVPTPLVPTIIDLTDPKKPPTALAFTGDGEGNNYKLAYAEYIPPATKGKRIKNDTYWFILHPQKGHGLGRRQLFEITNDHIGKFGMTIQEHVDAFKISSTSDGEMGKASWHVEYHLDRMKIPTDNWGRYKIEELQLFTLNPDTKHSATIWFKPDLLRKVFNACDKCFANLGGGGYDRVCLGHDAPAPSDGKKPMTAAQKHSAAQQRIAKRAKLANSFAF